MDEYLCACSKLNEGKQNINHDGVKKNVDSSENNIKIDSAFDCKQFLRQYLAIPLTAGLREIAITKPVDPIEFLGQWLLHYRKCEKKSEEMQEFEEELNFLRDRVKEKLETDDTDDTDHDDFSLEYNN